MSMVVELEEKLSELHAIPHDVAVRPAGVCFHLWMIGVASMARGRDIGKKLASHSIAWAKARGFRLAFAECTGALSTHILAKHAGAKAAHFIDYAEWKGAGANTVCNIPAQGHPGMTLMVAML